MRWVPNRRVPNTKRKITAYAIIIIIIMGIAGDTEFILKCQKASLNYWRNKSQRYKNYTHEWHTVSCIFGWRLLWMSTTVPDTIPLSSSTTAWQLFFSQFSRNKIIPTYFSSLRVTSPPSITFFPFFLCLLIFAWTSKNTSIVRC